MENLLIRQSIYIMKINNRANKNVWKVTSLYVYASNPAAKRKFKFSEPTSDFWELNIFQRVIKKRYVMFL